MALGRRVESKVMPAKEPHNTAGPHAPPMFRMERLTTKTKVISPDAGTGGTPSCCNPRTSRHAKADKRMLKEFSPIDCTYPSLSSMQRRKHHFLDGRIEPHQV